MSSPNHSHDSFAFNPYNQWDPYDGSRQTLADELKLCQLPDWDSERTYDDDPSIYIHYSIEWKVTVNNRAIMRLDTEQDIVLAPAAYWQHFLQPKLEDFLRKKKRSVKSKDTNVVVLVIERKERDLTKRFDDTTID
jgi:hypothetical protein